MFSNGLKRHVRVIYFGCQGQIIIDAKSQVFVTFSLALILVHTHTETAKTLAEYYR